MKKLIVILAILACASIVQAQSSRYIDSNGNYRNNPPGEDASFQWPTRNYNDPPPRGIQWNVERPAYQLDWYDINTGHYTTPPPGVIQSRPRTTYEMPKPY
jgi:hypothetical protein